MWCNNIYWTFMYFNNKRVNLKWQEKLNTCNQIIKLIKNDVKSWTFAWMWKKKSLVEGWVGGLSKSRFKDCLKQKKKKKLRSRSSMRNHSSDFPEQYFYTKLKFVIFIVVAIGKETFETGNRNHSYYFPEQNFHTTLKFVIVIGIAI